jgi:hypothetical protein
LPRIRGILDEGAELALAGPQLFLCLLAFGDVGGEPENILRLARSIALEGEFDARTNETAVPEEIALLDVEAIDFASR